MVLQEEIIFWYLKNKRNFPWRKTRDPYKIWVSEVILQQTRAAQGITFYEKFLKEFPTLEILAKSNEQKVLKTWQGLGYYTRARNLFHTACKIVNDFKGKFPEDYKKLKAFKGIGDYTASAIGSICFDLPEAVVDGNVYRVISRIFAIDNPIDISGSHKIFKEKANSLIKGYVPGLFNQAMMEFGSIQCVPRKPNCDICPVKKECVSYKRNNLHVFPVKRGVKIIKKRFFNYFVFHSSFQETIIEKRESGIWKNLYQFPLLETKKKINKLSKKDVLDVLKKYSNVEKFSFVKWNKTPIQNRLSHQKIEIVFWIVEIEGIDNFFIKTKDLFDYPMPKVLQNFREIFFIC